jgi:hypothetical protein
MESLRFGIIAVIVAPAGEKVTCPAKKALRPLCLPVKL